MVKERTDQRFYDNDGYKKRAACVCVKNENENEVLLISSSRNNENWIIPGGGIEDNENPEHAAEREVYEEAGVKGRLGRLLGIFENIERKHRTSVYLLIVDQEYDDWEEHKILGRKRKWFKLEDAKLELEKHKPVQGSYLSLLKGYESITKNIWNSNNNKNEGFDTNGIINTTTLTDNEYNNLSHSFMSSFTTSLPYLSTHSMSTYSSNSTSSSLSYNSTSPLLPLQQSPLSSSTISLSTSNCIPTTTNMTTTNTGFP